jgi:hypothetical protein
MLGVSKKKTDETKRDRRIALFTTLAECRMTNHKRNEDIREELGVSDDSTGYTVICSWKLSMFLL